MLQLFAGLPQRFVLDQTEDETASRIYRLRSVEPIERGAAGALYLRASLAISRPPGGATARQEVERLLAEADPDVGLSYAWDFVTASGDSVVHLQAACTFPEASFLKLVLALAREAVQDVSGAPASFWCRCGGGCRAGLPVSVEPQLGRGLPLVQRSAGIEDEQEEWDNRLDPSGGWIGRVGELSLMHYADGLSFSYSAVFGPTAHICEGAGVAGLVGTDRYEYGDEQGTVALVIAEREVRMELIDGIASFCGAGWTGDGFAIDRFESPAECTVAAERSHFHVVDHLDPESRPAYVIRGDRVEAVPIQHTDDREWLLARWVGPVMTMMGLLDRADLRCPAPEARTEPVAIVIPASKTPASEAPATETTPPTDEAVSSPAEPQVPTPSPSLRYRIQQWLPRVGVFLMAMVIFGFLAFSALFLPPLGAWFIYLFLMPFFVWIPGWTLHPIAGWAVCGAWLVAFPLLRRWIYTTPSGKRWRRRQQRWIARFEGGEADSGSWKWSGSLRSRGSAGSSRSGSFSGLSGRGGRFGGGGASGRW